MLGLQEWIAIQVAPVQAQAASRLLMLFVMFQMNIKKPRVPRRNTRYIDNANTALLFSDEQKTQFCH